MPSTAIYGAANNAALPSRLVVGYALSAPTFSISVDTVEIEA